MRKVTLDGKVLLELGVPGKPAPFMSGEPFHRCTHTALSPRGEIYVSDGYGNARVHKYSPDGKLLMSWGEPGTGEGEFNIVHNICCDADGWLYVADRENKDQPSGSFAHSATTRYLNWPDPTIIEHPLRVHPFEIRASRRRWQTASSYVLRPTLLGQWLLPMLSGRIETNGGVTMPYGGNDWLALTQEPTFESEIPICDPHHHFWDFRSERIPYQRYLLHELAADVNCGHNVSSTVFIEARSMHRPDGPVELRPVGEVEFVQGLAAAAATGLYGPCRAASAIIGHADLKLGDRVEPVLQALQAASPNRFRGIRHTVTWDPHPEIENREKEGALATADYRAGARVLARMGLSLDVGVCFPQLPELATFAKALPDLIIILNHLGGLTRVGPYANKDDEVIPAWRRGIVH